MATLRAQGLDRDRRRPRARPHATSRCRRTIPAAFDDEPLKPYNVGPDALLVNFKSVRFAFAPDAAGDAPSTCAPSRRLPRSRSARRRRCSRGDCGDWRARSAPAFVDQRRRGASRRSRGTLSARAAASATGGSRCSTIRTTCTAMFTTYFRDAGGTLRRRRARSGVAPRGAAPFATLESPPLYDIVRDVNKLSNNVMARQIFLTLATTRAPPPATTAQRADVVRRWLAARKLAMPGLVLENGSGLSRHERITRRRPRAAAARRRREHGARGVRELARRRGDRRHRASGASRTAPSPARRC